MGKRIPTDIKCKNCAYYTNHAPSPMEKEVGTGFCTALNVFVYSFYQFQRCFAKKGGEG